MPLPPGCSLQPMLKFVPRLLHPAFEVLKGTVVLDDCAGASGALRVGELRGEARAGGRLIEPVPFGQAADCEVRFDHYDPDLIGQVFPPCFEKNGRFEDAEGVALTSESGELVHRELANAGPDDVGKPLQFIGTAKHLAAENLAINRPVRGHQVVSEGRYYRAKRICPGLVGAVTEQVSIDHRDFPVAEEACDGGLAAGNATGEADNAQRRYSGDRWERLFLQSSPDRGPDEMIAVVSRM